jgi:Rrf2 family protein
MRLTGRIVFAIRAVAELVGKQDYMPLDVIAEGRTCPDYVRSAMSDLRRAGIVSTRRGRVGGYKLARPANEITLADIIRAVDGPLTVVQGERPDNLEYAGRRRRARGRLVGGAPCRTPHPGVRDPAAPVHGQAAQRGPGLTPDPRQPVDCRAVTGSPRSGP